MAPLTTLIGGSLNSVSGESNNYFKGAVFVEWIGKGGFWMSGTVRRAGDGVRLPGSESKSMRIPPRGGRKSTSVMGPGSPTRTGRSSRDTADCSNLWPT
jgi:hypothetical protein